MTAQAVLDAALAAGFRLSIRAGWKLHVEPAPPSDLLEQLREHKWAILELLADGPMQRAMAREMARPRPDHVVYVPVRGPRGWDVEVRAQKGAALTTNHGEIQL